MRPISQLFPALVSLLLLVSLVGCGSSAEPVAPTRVSDPKTAQEACAAGEGLVEEFVLATADGTEETNLIYLPPCYGASDAQYPVVYLLHGGSSRPSMWFNRLRTDNTMNELIESGKIRPMIIVASSVVEYQSEPLADYIETLLIPYVDQHYRTQPSREHRGLAGASVGGGLTLYVGSHKPELFGGLGLWAVAPAGRSRTDYGEWLDAVPTADLPQLYLDVGDQDGLRHFHADLHEYLNGREIEHVYSVGEGGHTLPYFSQSMGKYIIWFDGIFS